MAISDEAKVAAINWALDTLAHMAQISTGDEAEDRACEEEARLLRMALEAVRADIMRLSRPRVVILGQVTRH